MPKNKLKIGDPCYLEDVDGYGKPIKGKITQVVTKYEYVVRWNKGQSFPEPYPEDNLLSEKEFYAEKEIS